MTKKILIIEDDRPLAELLSHVLEMKGYNVLSASNGNDALKIIKKNTPDLIILDILLPDISGWDVLKALKHHTKTSSIPVLMCTDKNMMVDVERALSMGARGYITKPFDIDKVVDKIVALI
ncbi:MAG: response regulator [Elusimicrobiota bacterium]